MLHRFQHLLNSFLQFHSYNQFLHLYNLLNILSKLFHYKLCIFYHIQLNNEYWLAKLIFIPDSTVVPAFPSSKRVVKDGILYVNGQKITETAFAKDILNPITDDYIPDILRKNTDLNIIEYFKETLECTSIIPIKEISSGVVFARVICKHQNLNIITKAGGFGEENIIEEIIKFIRKYKRLCYNTCKQ